MQMNGLGKKAGGNALKRSYTYPDEQRAMFNGWCKLYAAPTISIL
ncbi:hypothetical protein KDH_24980 [Dictyobacter sp. S3.2.2.5]|uniref:Transposase putative helix-turn-helix domain-containing protein n=1 Tax=Dictyobacter halimunensis TaxID=3026934 RepID=A0ABQ6FN35_9CHLR|nr:hypothetical protein KDH_24980 [Dictyobacter sp. S3.2.2.5]